MNMKWRMHMKRAWRVAAVLALVFVCTSFQTFAKGEVRKEPQGLTGGGAGQSKEEDKIVAKVNGIAITEKSVATVVRRISGKATQEFHSPGNIRERAIDLLIFQELACQKAKALGLNVDRKSVEEAIAKLKKDLGTEEKYRNFLDREALTEVELAAQIERGLLFDLMFDKEVQERLVVGEDDVRKEYEKTKEKFNKPEKVIVSDVVFFLKADDKDSIRMAEDILLRIENDKDKDPNTLTPDGTFIVRQFQIKKEKEPELYNEAKKLKVGGLSGVLKLSDGLHILKLDQYEPEELHTFEEARPLLEAKLKFEARQKRIRDWEAELKHDAKIEIVKTMEGNQ